MPCPALVLKKKVVTMGMGDSREIGPRRQTMADPRFDPDHPVGYRAAMRAFRWHRVFGLVVLLCLSVLSGEGVPADRPSSKPEPVPSEEYPIYNRVIDVKFLTSQTETVLIGRLTATRLGPDDLDVPSRDYFRDRRPFAGQLAKELVTDFILKNRKPARLEERFTLSVPCRFVSEEGAEEPEVSLAPIPAVFHELMQAAPSIVGILKLSRVGFSSRRDLALVYVEENRRDGSGSGFLMLLQRSGQGWDFLDTEVLWVARPE